ncbi:MAG: hypothetical protein AAFY88_12470, partial [Acidobacteriota bacterium]
LFQEHAKDAAFMKIERSSTGHKAPPEGARRIWMTSKSGDAAGGQDAEPGTKPHACEIVQCSSTPWFPDRVGRGEFLQTRTASASSNARLTSP